ncbi:PAAR domain-containing protein [Photorhabdus luminescens]|uniref:PAAR domain-containing protein n=1 Tax=Photorhabdus luminescens TaxID=29488 RepID=UPI001049F535|nr:PAAR domain-containing protein [Photorhabdus luminescens]
MNSIIRISDKTTCGGQVISRSLVMKFDGISTTHKNGKLTCLVKEYGETRIIKGNSEYCDKESSVAFYGTIMRCSLLCQM